MECVPFETAQGESFPDRTEWDATAADLVATMLERWHLTAGEPFVGGATAAVLRVTRADGSPAVLKVGYPHLEAIWEAVGLEAAGGLSPTVYAQDAWTWSLLLEEVRPGTPLARAGLPVDEALAAGGELLAALHARPVPAGIPSLAEAMAGYAAQAADRMPGLGPALAGLGAHDLVERAVADLLELAGSSPDTALLHGDFNPGNILFDAGGGRSWRVVDPKPMHGDPAFDVWPLATQLGIHLESQLAAAARAAGVDADRAARWSFARTGVNVTWYLAAGELDAAAAEAAALRRWAALL
ncbi:streptomycin 6-kinase [soil metagenome]